MKYCTKCGNELFDAAVMCPKCGNFVETYKSTSQKTVKQRDPEAGTTLGWFSVFAGMYLPLAGWILGGIGLSTSNKNNDNKGKKVSILGIILSSAVSVICTVLFSLSYISGL